MRCAEERHASKLLIKVKIQLSIQGQVVMHVPQLIESRKWR